jgi:type III pantothenate kinase
VHFVSHNDLFPFVNRYETPKTLGIDRMVLAAEPQSNTKYNRLVIDAGTCVTYDFIDENDNYIGGAIAPGLRWLRYESLHALPLNSLC